MTSGMRRMRNLLTESSGSVDAASFILLATITAVGILCGAAALRDQLVQEFGDVATNLERLDQSYTITVGTLTSSYADNVPAAVQPVDVGVAASGE